MSAPLHAHPPLPIDAGPQARLPTAHGAFQVRTWREPGSGQEHVALSMGTLEGAEDLLVRLHSECLTGDVFGSQRCDCGPQLDLALQRISQAGRGLLIYMRGHEGRGIGLADKLRAYALQDQGLDTVDANLALGHAADARRYDAAAAILQALGVTSVRLMSNNPLKLAALQNLGVRVTERQPHEAGANSHNADYLATKRRRMGHLLGD